ncbi:MAG: response regulator transcription factor [Deltaproteobacteria bacterium]|nr:response regulator transcription factor [Deltaproteobacteria bacterium]
MPITILLADDHAVVRDGLKLILGATDGLKVVGEAGDGRDAVLTTARLHPDVVVMDIAMPELNGIDAARQVLAEAPKTRILMLSMYGSIGHVARALDAGATGFVLKESAGREVTEAVRAVHAGRRYLSAKISAPEVDTYLRRAAGRNRPFAVLSSREREVIQLVVEGRTSATIAKTLHLSPKTVETYRSRLKEKLGVDNVPGLVKLAIQHGLTTP